MLPELTKIFYCSFNSPTNGEITKDYGWRIEKEIPNIHAKIVDGKAVVVSKEMSKSVAIYLPKNANFLTKEEFIALDVSKESISDTLRRERNKRVLDRILK